MNKRGFRLAATLFGIFLLSSTIAHAATIGDMLNKMGSFFGSIGDTGVLGLKFLLWLTLFTIMNWALGVAGKDKKFDNKTKNVLSFTISLATVILVPDTTVLALFSLYTNIIIIVLGLIVPLLVGGAIHNTWKGATPWESGIRGILYIGFGSALMWFASNASSLFATTI